MVDYRSIITIEPGKCGGKPCVRGMRITVYDVLDYLASGMTTDEILTDFPYLTREDIQACLASLLTVKSTCCRYRCEATL